MDEYGASMPQYHFGEFRRFLEGVRLCICDGVGHEKHLIRYLFSCLDKHPETTPVLTNQSSIGCKHVYQPSLYSTFGDA